MSGIIILIYTAPYTVLTGIASTEEILKLGFDTKIFQHRWSLKYHCTVWNSCQSNRKAFSPKAISKKGKSREPTCWFPQPPSNQIFFHKVLQKKGTNHKDIQVYTNIGRQMICRLEGCFLRILWEIPTAESSKTLCAPIPLMLVTECISIYLSSVTCPRLKFRKIRRTCTNLIGWTKWKYTSSVSSQGYT